MTENYSAASSAETHSVLSLGSTSERLLLQAVLAVLGFDPAPPGAVIGLSGLQHNCLVVGVNKTSKHAVLALTGMGRAYTHKGSTGRLVMGSSQISFAGKEDRARRGLLLAGYDVQARYHHDGYSCDLLFFLNACEPEHLGLDRNDKNLIVGLEPVTGPRVPQDVNIVTCFADEPVVTLPEEELRENALAVGACFLRLSDFSSEAVVAVADYGAPDIVRSYVETELRRLRVREYFHPPADALLLGAISMNDGQMTLNQVRAVPEISKALAHPVGDNQVVQDVDKDDPLGVLAALEKHKLIEWRLTTVYKTASGKEVMLEMSKTPQESWINKIAKSAGDLIAPIIKALLDKHS
jgi:hypothetical protein